jgi:Xaa-Pro aminopeptidase
MKIKEFRQFLRERQMDFALLYNSDSSKANPNLFYFSGYGGLGALVIPAEKDPFLIVPEMEFEKAKKSAIRNVHSMEKKRFFESVHKAIKKKRIRPKNIGIDKNNFTLNSFKALKKSFGKFRASDVSLKCLKLREIKTKNEISLLRKSCGYADKILQKSINNFKEFKAESEVAAFLEYETKKMGLDLAFDPIVASGSNGSMPHYKPLNIKIKNGFCVVDFGVKFHGYCSDITRTVYVGNPSSNEKKIYFFLLKIQNDAIDHIECNKKCSEVYDFVCKNLGKYKAKFTHGLGHGVGVEIHELPNLTLSSKDSIRDNMVFTIEPGIYFPKKFGIRIEDTLLFKGNPTLLTKTDKDLLIID